MQEAISLPRNPLIIKMFRFAKLAENAGYGIDKMKSWTAFTGNNVGFKSDVTHATIVFYINTSLFINKNRISNSKIQKLTV